MPRGQPSKIDQVVAEVDVRDDTGTVTGTRSVTASERIVQAIRIGMYLEPAAASAGVHKDTVYGWLRTGAQAHAALATAEATGTPPRELTDHERRCMDFSDAVARAESEWELAANSQLERLARGDVEVVTITEKVDAKGNVVERTSRTERLAPNAQVLQLRLTRRFMERYAGRIEVTGAGGEPLVPEDHRARNLADSMRAYLAGAADGAEAAREMEAPAE